ncbi:MAG: helix-turn-helix domain-containing protein [Proteobacteria bacterium]|nr:helix-turn-helix domain-containing protein [Pseudomonadota bacterium]
MKYKSFEHMNCSLAQTLDVIGERWTLLILRDAFLGTQRFSDFERSLGIAKNILASRLARLVAEGVLDKRKHEHGHAEYVLTDKGLDLQPVLLSMTHWGDKHRPDPHGVRLTFVDRRDGQPIRPMSAVAADGRPLAPREVTVGGRPGGQDR